MTVRTDKFAVEDKVTWSNERFAKMTQGRERFGDGPFTIREIIEQQEGILGMGHTQHLKVEGVDRNWYSGAFFKLIGQPDYSGEM